eukprot:GHVQ01004842.1.p1 GENE.GHVQ01004842.1~~GHVQ01004842.1.p1  ORF type:complete len:524 (+),score=44.91 GHVQ01004842.1:91-1662(+)
MLVSGDGRYYTKEATEIICQIAAANGVQRVWIGVDGLFSTPAASAVIREREGGVCMGGFLLTASHNPGGRDEDFGLKYNAANGGPATESVTDAIYRHTESIKEYKQCKEVKIADFGKVGKTSMLDGAFEVEIIDPVEDWLEIMKRTFDFNAIQKLFSRPDFHMMYDGMHGVAGPYAKKLIVEELGAKGDWLMHCDPKDDFGKGHPDPNLVYAHELVKIMKVLTPKEADKTTPDFGAAGDGDCDRNMILGKGFFVTPSDSVAIIAAHAKDAIPYFRTHGILGVSRSMPTSAALDHVAKKLGVTMYEVPTGWKFFGNLMDANRLSICGEESFGTGSNHIREKDGLWAVLCWLSILAIKNQETSKSLVTVQDIVQEFWSTYGRNYYSRYDYENVDAHAANQLMDYLRGLFRDPQGILSKRPDLADLLGNMTIERIDEFEYKDPVDGSLSLRQGIRVYLVDGSRIIYRLSGTGSQGATVRVYIEKYESDASNLLRETQAALVSLSSLAVRLCQIEKFTGRKEPTVIT